MTDYIAQTILKTGAWSNASDSCLLSYEDRFLRRKVLTTVKGTSFLVDLAHTTSLDHGDAFSVSDGQVIAVVAAAEPLLQITGDLVQLAWHIGNRHTPCQIESDRLLIQNDAVIGHMLEHLGATVIQIDAPFTPEGGAYGHGRTHSHEHGATAHDH
jgi:urease accessory protein|tara:strand:+ start:84 stop:551 length:468 start_codon:yes stop_codon:yes gene_type:complete